MSLLQATVFSSVWAGRLLREILSGGGWDGDQPQWFDSHEAKLVEDHGFPQISAVIFRRRGSLRG